MLYGKRRSFLLFHLSRLLKRDDALINYCRSFGDNCIYGWLMFSDDRKR